MTSSPAPSYTDGAGGRVVVVVLVVLDVLVVDVVLVVVVDSVVVVSATVVVGAAVVVAASVSIGASVAAVSGGSVFDDDELSPPQPAATRARMMMPAASLMR
jgi:hypothetical protein